jgi:hypothetical protein
MSDTGTRIDRAFVASTIAELEPHLEAWDHLAVDAARPMMRPAWLLSWWLGLRASGVSTKLSVAFVFDVAGLAGVLPMHAEHPPKGPVVHHMLGGEQLWGSGVLLRLDAPADARERLTEAFAASSPRPRLLRLDAVDASGDWTARMASEWPGKGAHLHQLKQTESLIIRIDGDFVAWLRATRWSGEYRRTLRRLAERRVTLRKSTPSTYAVDLAELFRLHNARWNGMSRWCQGRSKSGPLAPVEK